MALRDGFYDRAGDRRHPIKVLSRPTTRAANGEVDTSRDSMASWPIYVPLAWASVDVQSGLDLIRSGREVNRTMAVFRVPFAESQLPTETMVIVWKQRYFEIQHVSDIEGESQLVEVLAQEVK